MYPEVHRTNASNLIHSSAKMNGRTILVVSNLVTIAVTACAVLFALNQNHNAVMMGASHALDHSERFLQTTAPTPCCNCQTGEVIPPKPPVGICFPATSTVQVQGEIHPRRLENVKIGDMVHVGSGKFEPVYSFGHYAPNSWTNDFVRLDTESGTLVLSSDHMVYVVSNQAFKAAFTVEPGDRLLWKNEPVTVHAITLGHKERGMLAPFTPSGKIVVDGFLASAFIHVPDTPTLHSWISPQWLAHSFEFPHRIACHYMGSCPDETYTSHGVSTWVARPLEVGMWVLHQDSFLLRGALMTVFVTVCAIFTMAEAVFFLYPALGMAAVLGLYVYNNNNNYRRRHFGADVRK